jgi:hypothetical protein
MRAGRVVVLMLLVAGLAGCGLVGDGDGKPTARQRCPDTATPLSPGGPAQRRVKIERGDQEAARWARELGLGPDEVLATRYVAADPDGSRSVHYVRYARCLEDIGGEIIVLVTPAGDRRDVIWGAAEGRLTLPDPVPAVDADRAAAEAGRTSEYRPARTGTPELVLLTTDGRVAVLTWRVRVTGPTYDGEDVLVDARTAEVLRRDPLQVS